METQQNKYSFQKITVMSFILSFLIVWVHNGPGFSEGVQYGIVGNILSVFDMRLHQVLTFVVPLYFMISGFLFFYGCTLGKLKDKLFRRVYSLGVPFVLWNVIAYGTVWVCVHIGILDSNAADGGIINAIINSSCSDLWFLRYLMILVALSPVLYFIMRSKPGAWALLGGVILIKFVFGTSIPVFPSFYLPIYVFGGMMGMHYQDVFLMPTKRIKMMAVLLMSVVIVFGLAADFKKSIFSMSLYGLLMPPCFWYGIEWIREKLHFEYRVKPWMNTNFFVYINHYNLMRIAIAIISAAGLSILGVITWYILLPCIVFIMLVAVGIIWGNFSPKSWKFVNGGRG